MTGERLTQAAADFRRMLPLPDDPELRAKLEQPVLHDLATILKRCCSEQHPLTPAKKTAGMFFMAAMTESPGLAQLAGWDGLTDERRAQVLGAWEGVLAAIEAELQPRFQYMAILRHADAASGARTFDTAVVAFDGFAGLLAEIDGLDDGDARDLVKDVHFALYAQPDDVAYCQAALAENLPGWFLSTSCDQPGFQFLQYHHGTTGAQLDINVGNHWFAVTGGPSAGPYNGGGWRDQMLADLVRVTRTLGAAGP